MTGSLPWVWGPLLENQGAEPRSSLSLAVQLCDLKPAMIPKGQVGLHYRAISRNGRLLLASPVPLSELSGLTVRLRIAPWHRRILSGDPPQLHGLLLAIRTASGAADAVPHRAILTDSPLPGAALYLDPGGCRIISLLPPVNPV